MPATHRLRAIRITMLLCIAWFLAITSCSSAATEQDSITDSPLRLEPESVPGFTAIQRGKGLSFHKANYVQPVTWSPEYQGSESEVVFQISLKQRFLINNVYLAYTQKSMWQAINRRNSAPFRETNYNPEIFLRLLPGDDLLHRWHLDRWGFDLGFEHESNGRAQPESRSQNRAYVAAFRPDGDTLWYFCTWYRLPEDPKSNPLDPHGDDNPLADDYYGYGEIAHRHHFGRNRMLMARVHGNVNTGKGAIELQLSKPSSDGDVFYLFSVFNGYGETMTDYDNSVTRIGFGLMFNR